MCDRDNDRLKYDLYIRIKKFNAIIITQSLTRNYKGISLKKVGIRHYVILEKISNIWIKLEMFQKVIISHICLLISVDNKTKSDKIFANRKCSNNLFDKSIDILVVVIQALRGLISRLS